MKRLRAYDIEEAARLKKLEYKLDFAMEIMAMLDHKIDTLREDAEQRFTETEYVFEVIFEALRELDGSAVERPSIRACGALGEGSG